VRMTLEEFLDHVAALGDEHLLMDGYNDCILGLAERFNSTYVLYDVGRVFKRLQAQGMTYEEAHEFWAFNQVGAWVGEGTPAFLTIQVHNK